MKTNPFAVALLPISVLNAFFAIWALIQHEYMAAGYSTVIAICCFANFLIFHPNLKLWKK